MKSKYLLLFVGLSLLLLSFTMGCGESQTEAYQRGYNAGFNEGYDAGLAPSPSQAPATAPSPAPTKPAPAPTKAPPTPTASANPKSKNIPTPTTSPKPAPTTQPAPRPAITSSPTLTGPGTINSIAYIHLMAWDYSDDADPEVDGIKIRIYFYNRISQPITGITIPCEASIQIYGNNNSQRVYSNHYWFNQNAGIIGDIEVRIPYSLIPVNPSKNPKGRVPRAFCPWVNENS